MTQFRSDSDYIYIRTYLVDGKPAEYSVYDAHKKEYSTVGDLDEFFSEHRPATKTGDLVEFDTGAWRE